MKRECKKCSNAQFCLIHSKSFNDVNLIGKLKLLLKSLNKGE